MDGQIKFTYTTDKVAPAPSSPGSKATVSTEEVFKALTAQFSSQEIQKLETAHKGDPFIVVSADKIVEICKFLRDAPSMQFVNLQVVSAVDYPGTPAVAATETQAANGGSPARIEVVYILYSYSAKSQITLKVQLTRENPQVPSICSVYRAANWYERECYDMLGVVFNGHPNHQRILCPQDWVGFPLRKDYAFPEEYNGMKVPL